MSIRARWIVIAALFGIAGVGHGISVAQRVAGASLAVLFLAVGIWDSGRPSHYMLNDPPEDPS